MLDGILPLEGTGSLGPGPRRPDRMLAVMAWLWVLGVAVLLTTFSFGRDQSIYATVGHGMLSGQMPYRDLWDFKPPGIFVVFAFAEWVFGHNMAGARILEALGLLLMTGAMASLSKRWFGAALPGLVGAVIAATVELQLDFWHSGQPESFGGMLTIFALWCATKPASPKRWLLWWGFAGVLLGAATLMKPPLGGSALVLAAYLARKHLPTERKWAIRGLLGLVFGGALTGLLCLFWFWVKGALPATIWTMRDYVPGYTALGWQGEHHALEMFYHAVIESLTRFSAWIAFGCAALCLLPRHSAHEPEEVLLLLGCAIVQLTGVAMQAKFFQYHYGATMPLLGLAAGLGWYKGYCLAWVKRPWPVVGLAVLFGLCLMMRKPVRDVPGTVLERSWARLQFLLRLPEFDTRQKLDTALTRAADYDLASNFRVATWVKEHTTPAESILVWGFEPAIYWFSDRRPATRFIYNVAQRSQWQTEKSQSLFIGEVMERRPKIVIVQHNDCFPGVTGFPTDSAADLSKFAALDQYVSQNYAFTATIDDFDLFTRKPDVP